MSEIYTTGNWKPKDGEEDAFIAAWAEFAKWASGMPGVGALRLTRDLRDPGQYVSFAGWESEERVRAWKGSPEFSERLARVRQHVDEFQPTELEVIVRIDAMSRVG